MPPLSIPSLRSLPQPPGGTRKVAFSWNCPEIIRMNVDIGWWAKDSEGKRLQMNVRIFGGEIIWKCKSGRHQRWEPYGPPTEEDWDILIEAAERRVPRRTIHLKVMELIRKRGR